MTSPVLVCDQSRRGSRLSEVPTRAVSTTGTASGFAGAQEQCEYKIRWLRARIGAGNVRTYLGGTLHEESFRHEGLGPVQDVNETAGCAFT
jgi:hypothetical protein